MMQSAAKTDRRFVFLDRDGTIIEDRHYISRPDDVCLFPGAAAALRELQNLGFGLAVVTNQAGVGRGYFGLDALSAVHARLEELLAAEGVRLDGIYICPHAPDAGCPCRKPRPGLFKAALAEHDFVTAKSFMIGDKAIDIEFGKKAGLTTILVRTGYGAEAEREGRVQPHHTADDLSVAAHLIRTGLHL